MTGASGSAGRRHGDRRRAARDRAALVSRQARTLGAPAAAPAGAAEVSPEFLDTDGAPVTGQVLDARTRRPVAGAVVTLSAGVLPVHARVTATTDARGRFALPRLRGRVFDDDKRDNDELVSGPSCARLGLVANKPGYRAALGSTATIRRAYGGPPMYANEPCEAACVEPISRARYNRESRRGRADFPCEIERSDGTIIEAQPGRRYRCLATLWLTPKPAAQPEDDNARASPGAVRPEMPSTAWITGMGVAPDFQ